MLLNLKHPMEERRAGVFLGTVDEINQSEYRVVVKVTDTSKKSSSEMHTDLQIHHREFKSPNSDIIINRELKHTKEMNFFDAKNTDQSFMLITYKPLVKTTYDYTEDGKNKKGNITIAQEAVLNELNNTVQIRRNLATGRKSYEVDDFIKIYAHGRIFINDGDKVIDSSEITLNESSTDLTHIEDSLIKGEQGAFEPFVALARKLILLHINGLIIGDPSLANIKIADSRYKWNSPALKIRNIDKDTNSLVKNILRCIDLCHLIFNNSYFFNQIGIDDISHLEMWRIKNKSPEEIRPVIIFSVEIMLKAQEIINQTSCITILKESFNRLYQGNHTQMLDSLIKESYNIDWNKVVDYLLNPVNLENLFTIATKAHNEGNPVKKSNRYPDFEQYQSPFLAVKATPILHDSAYVYTDAEGTKKLVFKNILHQTEFYEMDSRGNISEYTLPNTPVFLYAGRGMVFTDKNSGCPIGFYYTDENLILEIELQKGSRKVISKYKFAYNTQLQEYNEPVPVASLPFGGDVSKIPSYRTIQESTSDSVSEIIRNQPGTQPYSVIHPMVSIVHTPSTPQQPYAHYPPHTVSALIPLTYANNHIQVGTQKAQALQRVFYKIEANGTYSLWVTNHTNGGYEPLVVERYQEFAMNGYITGLRFSIDNASKFLQIFQQTSGGLVNVGNEPLFR